MSTNLGDQENIQLILKMCFFVHNFRLFLWLVSIVIETVVLRTFIANPSLSHKTYSQDKEPLLKVCNYSIYYAPCKLSWSHETSPEVTKPLLKLRNLSSHHTTSPYITQIKSRDFWPTLSQTSFKSCKQNLRTTSPKVTQPLSLQHYRFGIFFSQSHIIQDSQTAAVSQSVCGAGKVYTMIETRFHKS